MKHYCHFYIGKSKREQRLEHWREIKSRVTTHEGEPLTGSAGREYQKKYSSRYLGKDLSVPPSFEAPQYQKELAKTK